MQSLIGIINSFTLGDYLFFLGIFLTIVLFIYVVYLIKGAPDPKDYNKQNELFDLEAITKAIETDYKPGKIELTHYEEEQENNAIISYHELVENKDKLGLDYDDEFIFEDETIEVKKINLSRDGHFPQTKLGVKLMQYDKEEAFLKALKELQSNLLN